MFAKGADIFMKDSFGHSPFFHVCWMGKEIFFDFFMEKNADINETDNYK